MMINDPQLKACPACNRPWGDHDKRCKYYSRPQPKLFGRAIGFFLLSSLLFACGCVGIPNVYVYDCSNSSPSSATVWVDDSFDESEFEIVMNAIRAWENVVPSMKLDVRSEARARALAEVRGIVIAKMSFVDDPSCWIGSYAYARTFWNMAEYQRDNRATSCIGPDVWNESSNFAQIVVEHELGHAFGLKHVDDPDDVMYTFAATHVRLADAAKMEDSLRVIGNRARICRS